MCKVCFCAAAGCTSPHPAISANRTALISVIASLLLPAPVSAPARLLSQQNSSASSPEDQANLRMAAMARVLHPLFTGASEGPARNRPGQLRGMGCRPQYPSEGPQWYGQPTSSEYSAAAAERRKRTTDEFPADVRFCEHRRLWEGPRWED